MREHSTPLTVRVPTSGNLTDHVVTNAREAADTAVASELVDDEWHDISAAQFHAQVVAVAKGFVAAGIRPGDRIALISKTRYEWTLFDYAIWFAGAVSVPVYETSSAEQIRWILSDSGATAVVAEGASHLSRITTVRAVLDDLHHVWTIDDNAVDVLTRLGDDVTDADLEIRRTTAGPDDLATLIYTSGTTGRPKGCMLTHGNFLTELGVALPELEALFGTHQDDAAEQPSSLLFLPLAHVFARIIQIGCIKSRVRLGYSSDIRQLAPCLQSFQPSFVLAVPRVFEKLFNTASQRATADGRGKLFDRAVDTAIAYSRGLDRGRPSIAVRARHAVFERLVYPGLRDMLGGACEHAISGGAPLGERLGHFYRGIGINVLEGYGLTESTAAITVNLLDAQKIGTVGRPLPGVAVRVADDGELLFRGGQIFAGYWNDEPATRDALEPDGWLHTGDVGEVDDEGFVRITGRKKEILVTAGGKNVAPAALEDRLRSHPLVSQALVVGDRQPFIAALITIDAEAFRLWCEASGKKGTVADHVDDVDLRAELQQAVDEANTAVSKAESIRKFQILGHDWSEEAGQLTPSLKLKRNVVLRECREEIAYLYT